MCMCGELGCSLGCRQFEGCGRHAGITTRMSVHSTPASLPDSSPSLRSNDTKESKDPWKDWAGLFGQR
jgi:hypothetical protein